jgi:serine protease Do
MRRNTMKHKAPAKELITFVAAILFLVSSVLVSAAASQSTGESRPTAAPSGTLLKEESQKARETFLKKDFKEAASAIRQAALLLNTESAKAAGDAKQDLIRSAEELDELANKVDKRAVRSEKELDASFARAEAALAKYYHAIASESWAKKEVSVAGRYLGAAVVHVENALNLGEQKIREESKNAIRQAKEVAGKMEKDVGLSGSEVGRSLEAVRKEIGQLTRRVRLDGPAGTFSIQVAGKSTGPADLTTAIMNVAKQSMPKVVYIEVTESQVVNNPFWQFEGNPNLRRFFGIPKMPRKFKQETKGLGSGIIIDAQGHILTNNHVAGGASKIQVTLADGNQYPATLVGADPKTDLAVIRVTAKDPFPFVTFGDSDKAEVGEWVVAIGAPRALEKTVTQGIISAKHRTGITDPNTYQDFLQTDAAINPGNSGGPLLNLYGQVIGVNAAIASASGGSEGIGFTIPSRMAVYIANALLAHGKVERGWLGVSIRDLTPELAKTVQVQNLAGALIVAVVKGGPAEKDGLKRNDVVISYEGRDIPDSATLRNDVAQTAIGQKVKLAVLRDGKKIEVTVTIGSLEESTKMLAATVEGRLGAQVRLPTPKEVEQYGLNPNEGVVISRLEPKGSLSVAGFEVDDMILAINGQPVEGMDGFIGLVSVLPPGKATFYALDHRTGNVGSVFVVTK